MRKTKEILRLHHEARRSGREIARTLGVSPATFQECLRRARIAGVDWTAALDLNDTVLSHHPQLARTPARKPRSHRQPDRQHHHHEGLACARCARHR
jgi:IS30 family transposase